MEPARALFVGLVATAVSTFLVGQSSPEQQPANVISQRAPCANFDGTGRIPYCGDKPAIYAIIDAVTFEPSEEAAERIRIMGTFTVPVPVSSGLHARPQHGFLYFSLSGESEERVRQDWSDLARLAGTSRVVGFGEYWVSRPMAPGDRPYEAGARGGTMNSSLVVRVHPPGEAAEPEPYPLPHELGVFTRFDRPVDLSPRFGRPSAVIIEELQAAHR